MKGRKRLSPFAELLRVVESEIFDLTMELQREGTEWDASFVMGYRCALNVILERAYAIYNRQWVDGFGSIDERTESASEYLLQQIKRGS